LRLYGAHLPRRTPEWHRGLTAGASSHLPKHQVGALRDAQGWIGGTSPLDAALVPPPLEHVPALMDDLVVFVNRADLDDVVRAAGQATTNLIRAVADLQTSWDARLTGVRAGAAARRVLAVLPQYPVLDAATLAHALGVSDRASRTPLNTLAGHQIVVPFHPHGGTVGRPRQWWVAEELVDLVTAWSR
jgi:hypothetical protein